MSDIKRYTAEESLNMQSAAYQKGCNEGYQLCKSEHSAGMAWEKATKENMRRSAILRDSVLPENHIHQWIIRAWDEKGVLFTNKVEKEWWELEILDEGGQSKEQPITSGIAEHILNLPEDKKLPSMPLPTTDPFQQSKEGGKEEWDSERLIGRVKDRFKELEAKEYEWRSYYNGWLEGRSDMLQQIKGWGEYKPEQKENEAAGIIKWLNEKGWKPQDDGSWFNFITHQYNFQPEQLYIEYQKQNSALKPKE